MIENWHSQPTTASRLVTQDQEFVKISIIIQFVRRLVTWEEANGKLKGRPALLKFGRLFGECIWKISVKLFSRVLYFLYTSDIRVDVQGEF